MQFEISNNLRQMYSKCNTCDVEKTLRRIMQHGRKTVVEFGQSLLWQVTCGKTCTVTLYQSGH